MISIVIPVYNHQEALNEALSSIASQTHKDVEVIVVDDGSAVPVPEDDRYTLIPQINAGAPAARNRGLDAAKGDHIIFWDADVVADNTFLEKLHSALEKNKQASVAYANMRFGSHKMTAAPFSLEKLKENNYIHSTSLIRKKDCPRWDESLKRFQDWDLWLTMAEQGRGGVWIDEYLFAVTERKSGMSSWLPSFAYKKPWKWLPWFAKKVRSYEQARGVISQKHSL